MATYLEAAVVRIQPYLARTPDLSLTGMMTDAKAETVEAVVDHLVGRFLSAPLAAKDRAVLVEFLRGKVGASTIRPSETLESTLRELLYLVLSTPEYQLG